MEWFVSCTIETRLTIRICSLLKFLYFTRLFAHEKNLISIPNRFGSLNRLIPDLGSSCVLLFLPRLYTYSILYYKYTYIVVVFYFIILFLTQFHSNEKETKLSNKYYFYFVLKTEDTEHMHAIQYMDKLTICVAFCVLVVVNVWKLLFAQTKNTK